MMCSLNWTPGWVTFRQEMFEPAPALLQGLDPQVDAAQFQQVEGVEEHPVVVGLAVELLEVRRAVRVAADRLAVEDQGGRPERRHGLPDEGEPVRPVVSPTGEQPDPAVLLPDDHSVAVVLYLVDPVGTDRRLVGPVGMHGSMKPGGCCWGLGMRHFMGGRWRDGRG